MPQYERYEGESQEAADARIAKNRQEDSERDKRENSASRQMAYDYEAGLRHDMDQIMESRPASVNKAVAHIDRKRQERENMENHPEWSEMGQEIERSDFNTKTTGYEAGEKSYPTALRERGYDIHKKNFNYIIDNMEGDISEIIGWDDEMGRDEVGLYAVKTSEGIKFVHGLTDRWTGYGKSGNPNYKTSAEAKYGSAKQKAADGDFLTYEKAYKIYRRQAKGSIADRFIQALSGGGGESSNTYYTDE